MIIPQRILVETNPLSTAPGIFDLEGLGDDMADKAWAAEAYSASYRGLAYDAEEFGFDDEDDLYEDELEHEL